MSGWRCWNNNIVIARRQRRPGNPDFRLWRMILDCSRHGEANGVARSLCMRRVRNDGSKKIHALLREGDDKGLTFSEGPVNEQPFYFEEEH
jgi:hypothetical protein